MRWLARVLSRATILAAARLFYRLERAGDALPPGPTLVIVNHPNMLMDPALALHVIGDRARVLAKAPHFITPVFGWVLGQLGALPVYRLRDDPAQLVRNKHTIRRAVAALAAGETVLVFPEGGSHSRPDLAPLKTGAARIALTAEAEAGWALGLRIVPLGLAYERKDRFRSRVVARLGEPLPVARWRGEYESERSAAVRGLTDSLARALERASRPVRRGDPPVRGSAAVEALEFAPLAAAGAIVWYVPCAVAWAVARLARPEPETMATVKLLTGLLAFPATYLAWLALAARLGGAALALVAAAALPALGLATLRAHDRLEDEMREAESPRGGPERTR